MPRIHLTMATALAMACTGATAPTPLLIREHQAGWNTLRPAHYTYQYELTGFFNLLADQPMTLEVRSDTVRSAVFVATGDTVSGDPGFLPTIDTLFALALSLQTNAQLSAITFDPTYDYPTRMDVPGPPDAAGTVFASTLHVLP
ncbi:MAG: DUF6174 domain-containing protein [Gemmatimonadales bacterium]